MIHSNFHSPDSNEFLYPTCQTLKTIHHFRRIIISHNIKSLLYDIGPVHEIHYCPISLTDAKADGDSVTIVTQIRAPTMSFMQTEGN
jgi:hypothetical protein